jgi:hypothetical protein
MVVGEGRWFVTVGDLFGVSSFILGVSLVDFSAEDVPKIFEYNQDPFCSCSCSGSSSCSSGSSSCSSGSSSWSGTSG